MSSMTRDPPQPNAFVITIKPDTLAAVTRALPHMIGIGAHPEKLKAEKRILDRVFGPDTVRYARMHGPVPAGTLPPLMDEWWPSLEEFAESAGIAYSA
jgi:hypothetical protein